VANPQAIDASGFTRKQRRVEGQSLVPDCGVENAQADEHGAVRNASRWGLLEGGSLQVCWMLVALTAVGQSVNYARNRTFAVRNVRGLGHSGRKKSRFQGGYRLPL